MGFTEVSPPRKVRFKINHTNTIMAPNGKAFSSQIKKMSKKPLKYNPEEVMVINVDMAQGCSTLQWTRPENVWESSKRKMSLVWLSMLLTSSMKNMGSTGCQLSVTTMELM